MFWHTCPSPPQPRLGEHHQVAQQNQAQPQHGVEVPLVAFVDRRDGQRHQREQQGAVSRRAGADAAEQAEVGGEGDHRSEDSQVQQGADIAAAEFDLERCALRQGDQRHQHRAVGHGVGVGGKDIQPAALMTRADHIAQREAVGAERAQTDAFEQLRRHAGGGQVLPEQRHDAGQPQQRRRQQVGAGALAEKQQAVEGIEQHRHREDHRFQPAADISRRVVKAEEVETEHAAALQHAEQMIARGDAAQTPQQHQDD